MKILDIPDIENLKIGSQLKKQLIELLRETEKIKNKT